MAVPLLPQLYVGMDDPLGSINELLDGVRALFTLQVVAREALTITFQGGRFKGTDLANQTITLPASTTSYCEADATTGAVTSNTTGYTTGRIKRGVAVTSADGIVTYTPEDQVTWLVA